MKARGQIERVYADRVRDDGCVTDGTLEGFAVVAPDGTVVDVYGRIGIGPGIGPHLWRDVHALRRFGWRIQQLADALLAAGATSPTTEPALPEGHIPGQLTIDDHLEGVSS